MTMGSIYGEAVAPKPRARSSIGRYARAAAIAMLLSLGVFPAAARPGTADTADAVPRGMTVLAGRSYYASSLSSSGSGNFEFFIGIGYNITPAFLLALNVRTGRERVDPASSLPVNGSLALGGAELEAGWTILRRSAVRPFVAAALGLSTILDDQSGYQGPSVRLEGGGEYYFTNTLSLVLGGWLRYGEYRNSIVEGDFERMKENLPDRAAGLALAMRVHFNFLP